MIQNVFESLLHIKEEDNTSYIAEYKLQFKFSTYIEFLNRILYRFYAQSLFAKFVAALQYGIAMIKLII